MGKKVAVGGVEGAPDTVYQVSGKAGHEWFRAHESRSLGQLQVRPLPNMVSGLTPE